MTRQRVLLVGLLLLAPALAGCASDDEVPAAKGEPIRPGSTTSTGTGSPTVSAPPPAVVTPRGTSERWHFHDYWKGNPTITLLDTNVTLNLSTQTYDGLPGLGVILELPHGTIVPPETGYLTFNVTWETDTAGLVNLTYKPADSNDFFTAGDIEKGVPLVLNTTESNCDVPHRQASAWKFNITAKPGGTPPAIPARDLRLVITATIGRPLFIDPPHLNWWRDGDIMSIVADGNGTIQAARTPAGNATVPPAPPLPGVPEVPPSAPPTAPNLQPATQTPRVPVDAGRIVPEGTKSIVAMLNWTSNAPDGKLALRFAENNYPSEGSLDLSVDGEGSRLYVLKVAQAQTDTTYSNRTTWEFRIVPEGEPAAAFDGSFTLVAWATRLEPAAAVAAITAPSG